MEHKSVASDFTVTWAFFCAFLCSESGLEISSVCPRKQWNSTERQRTIHSPVISCVSRVSHTTDLNNISDREGTKKSKIFTFFTTNKTKNVFLNKELQRHAYLQKQINVLFLLCYHDFELLLLNLNNTTTVWLILLGMHNNVNKLLKHNLWAIFYIFLSGICGDCEVQNQYPCNRFEK